MHESSQQASLLHVSLAPEPPCLFLGLCGELDISNVDEVPRDDYSSRRDLTTVLVDLGELTFCDVTGLRALLAFREIHEAQGRSVAVVRASAFLSRLMRLCEITDWPELARPENTPV
ncbi:MAG: STAS domain-containing protein [Actinomycetes bacterium]